MRLRAAPNHETARPPRSPLAAALALLLLAGCRQDMYDQPRYEPLESSDFFRDGRASRLPVEGTVARGQLRTDALLYAGKADGKDAEELPFPVDRALLDRGRERYRIFCSPCHGGVGDGRGMIVQRGLSAPPSFHIDRLREAPVGHYFNVITNGYGAMYPYGYRVPVNDRWAIIAYVRALQLSQHATVEDLTAEQRRELDGEAQ